MEVDYIIIFSNNQGNEADELVKFGLRGVRNNKGIWDAYFWIKDVDSLYQEFSEKKAEIVYEPELKESYGCYEFAVRDPDGHTLAFGQEYQGNPFFELNPIRG